MAPSSETPLIPVSHLAEIQRARRAGVEGWQVWETAPDGTVARARSKPWRVSHDLYARAVRAMKQVSARRGPRGLGVDEDRDAKLWRAWNEAAMRQCRILIPQRTTPRP